MKRRIHALLVLVGMLLVAPCWMSQSLAQTRILRVGGLTVNNARQFPLEPFYQTLRERGWIDGKNVRFEFSDAGGDPRRLEKPAAELVRHNVDVLFPIGPPAVRAAFAATRVIPIVAHDLETDPVAAGYAQGYAHPGGNLTGLFLVS